MEFDRYIRKAAKINDIVKFANSIGVTIAEVDFSDNTSGFLVHGENTEKLLESSGKTIIGYSRKLSVEARKYVIAYELAQYIVNCMENREALFVNRVYIIDIIQEKSKYTKLARQLLFPE